MRSIFALGLAATVLCAAAMSPPPKPVEPQASPQVATAKTAPTPFVLTNDSVQYLSVDTLRVASAAVAHDSVVAERSGYNVSSGRVECPPGRPPMPAHRILVMTFDTDSSTLRSTRPYGTFGEYPSYLRERTNHAGSDRNDPGWRA